MAFLYHLCLWIVLLEQCSSFSVKNVLDRVDTVESRLEAISVDLAEIFGKIFAIDNKLNLLNLTRDTSYREDRMDEENKEESRRLLDYLIKGAAAEKRENTKNREALIDKVNDLTANNTYNLMQLQNMTEKEMHELKTKMETLVNKELLTNQLEVEGAVYKRSLKTLENEMTKSLKKLENEMTSKLTSEIKALKSELEIRKESEEILVKQIDSLTANQTESKGVINLVKEKLINLSSSCSNLRHEKSGVYVLQNGVEVYCDQTTDGGGWTVFQRRKDGSVDFERKWAVYKAGFGNLDGEFWLGNDIINNVTATGKHELRIDMADFEGNKAYAKYSNFKVMSESDNYAIEVSGYSGDAGDSLSYHNGMAFSTNDRDNDKDSKSSCSVSYRGAWWYGRCHDSNLNGFYYNGANSPKGKGIVWYHWKKTNTYSLKYVEMKFR